MTKKKLLIIEPHSDDSIIAIGGFLEKYRNDYDIYFCLVCASDLNMYHGFVSRDDRLQEYENYVNYFSGTWIKTKIENLELPLDMESKLDLVPTAKLVKLMEETLIQLQPDKLMMMGPSFHHDHTIVYNSLIAATRPTFGWSPSEIIVLENPTYVHDKSSLASPNAYVELSEKEIDQKNDLFKNLFPSQVRTKGNYLSAEGIKRWAAYRGMEGRCDFAEAYHQYFKKI